MTRRRRVVETPTYDQMMKRPRPLVPHGRAFVKALIPGAVVVVPNPNDLNLDVLERRVLSVARNQIIEVRVANDGAVLWITRLKDEDLSSQYRYRRALHDD
jgi:hypothetical protein